jgi:transcriptional regulator with XRE-family HTH domain
VSLGLEINEARRRDGLTATELADLCGVSAQHLGDVLHDKRGASAGLVKRLALELGVDETRWLDLAGHTDPTEVLALRAAVERLADDNERLRIRLREHGDECSSRCTHACSESHTYLPGCEHVSSGAALEGKPYQEENGG